MTRTCFYKTLTAGLASLSSCSKPAAGPSAFRFSGIPGRDAGGLRDRFGPIGTHLSKTLSIPVEYVHFSDYKASVQAFKIGAIHLGWFNGAAGVEARAAVAGAKAIVQGDEDAACKSLFVAHKDTGLSPSTAFPAGIAPLKFTYSAATSTSGRIMPAYFIKENTGKLEAAFFTRPISFSGGHDATLALVGSGKFEAGVCDSQLYQRLVAAKKVDPDIVRAIWHSPAFPDYHFTAHPEMEKFGVGFMSKLSAALIDMTTAMPELLKAFPRKALISTRNENYAITEAACKQLDLI